MEQQIAWLIVKFSKGEYLRELQQGKLYLNPWSYFKNCEDHTERKDENEGLHYLIQPKETEVTIDGHTFSPEGGFLGGSIEFPDDNIKNKIFSACVIMRGEAVREDWKIFDDKVKDFGDSFIVIRDVKEFFKRLKDSLIKLQNEGIIEGFGYGLVTYYDEKSYDGEIGPFKKTIKFAHQKEWRLVVRTADSGNKPFELLIGSIEDISTIEKTTDFKNQIKPKEYGEGLTLEFS